MNKKTNLLLIFTVLLLLFYGYVTNYFMDKAFQNFSSNILVNKDFLDKSVNYLVEEKKEFYIKKHNIIFSEEQLLKALESKDRELFYDLIIKDFQNVRQFDDNFWGLHIVFPDNLSFIRVHRPNIPDEIIKKGTMPLIDEVNGKKRIVTNFNSGRFGYFLRVGIPIFSKNNIYLGLAEYSVNIDNLVYFIYNKLQYDNRFLVKDNGEKFLSDFETDKSGLKIYKYTKKRLFDEDNIINLKNITLHKFDGKIYETMRIPLSSTAVLEVAMDVTIFYDEYKQLNFIALFNGIFVSLVTLMLFGILHKLDKNNFSLKEKSNELEEYKRVLDESDIVSKADLSGNIKYLNKKFENISGYTQEELIGKPHSIVRHPDMPKELFKEMWEKIQNKDTFKGIIKNRKKDGSSYYVDATIVPILDFNGNIKEYIGVRHDITDIMNPKKQFLDDIKSKKEPIAIIGKINNYSLLKEFYGEDYINSVEDYLHEHLLSLIPSASPLSKIYKLDNGEFGFLRESNGAEPSNIQKCLKKFQDNIENSDFIIFGNKIDIKLNFAFTTEKENSFENLRLGIKISIKENINIVFANKLAISQKEKAQNNLRTVDVLKESFVKDSDTKIVSYFQPVLNNKTNEIEKYESLVRLIKSDKTVVAPAFFIDIAKKAGYYKFITEIVLENSFKALDKTDKEITINLSTMDIENLDIRNKILGYISDPKYYGRVVFELLEDEVAKDFETVKDFISLAKVVGGVKIAIDDFGSGYSNFERLLDFQPDILKIDGSLIKNIVVDEFSEHVVEAIVLFAKKQNIKTVAEFIANEDISEKVKKMGIDYSQGYFIGKPKELKFYL